MTTPFSRYNGTIDAEVEIFLLSNEAIYASTAFLAYSSLLLFGHEINYVWKQPSRPSSWLHVLIRYPAVLAVFISAGLNSYTPNCNSIARLAEWSQNIALIATYLVQILRTYAVCGNRRSLAGLLAVLCLPTIAIETMDAIKAACTNAKPLSPVVVTVEIVFDILFESITICATVWGTWSQVIAAKQAKISRETLAHSLLRNGVIYYILFLVFQMSDLVSYNLQVAPTATKVNLLSNQFTNPIRWGLTCQFILELRERSEKLGSMSGISLPTISSFQGTVNFVRATLDQDFGEPLVHPIHSMDIEEMDEATVSALGLTNQRETQNKGEDIELRERQVSQVEGEVVV